MQPSLFPVMSAVCGCGTPTPSWGPPCPDCAAWVDAQIAIYRQEQAAGVYDERGFTPAERTRYERKAARPVEPPRRKHGMR